MEDYEKILEELDGEGLGEYDFQPSFTEVNGREVIDYTAIDHDRIFLVNRKGIFDSPRPSWIPALDIKDLARQKFLPCAVASTDGSWFVSALDDGGFERTYRMSSALLAITLDYYMKRRRDFNSRYGFTERVSLPQGEKSMERGRLSGIIGLAPLVTSDPVLVRERDWNKVRGRGSRNSDVVRQINYAFANYNALRERLRGKLLDLAYEKQDFVNSYQKGEETSYGDSNLSNALLEGRGVLIKKQNGSTFTAGQRDALDRALGFVWEVYGDMSGAARDYGLKVSYADGVNQYARKAQGIFYPYHKAIGVSFFKDEKKSPSDLIMAHEVAHWMDSMEGERSRYRYASDIDGSLESRIAGAFRSEMLSRISWKSRKSPSVPSYWKRTCECLARAMEEHYAVERGIEGLVTGSPYYLPKDVFMEKIYPLTSELVERNRASLGAEKNVTVGSDVSRHDGDGAGTVTYDNIDNSEDKDMENRTLENGQPKGCTFNISVDTLKKAIRCAGNDPQRYFMTGVRVEEDGSVISTDGRRVYCNRKGVYGKVDGKLSGVTLPPDLVREACGQKGIVTFTVAENGLDFTASCGAWTREYKGVDMGEFPNWRKVIPPAARFMEPVDIPSSVTGALDGVKFTKKFWKEHKNPFVVMGDNCYFDTNDSDRPVERPFERIGGMGAGFSTCFNPEYVKDAVESGFGSVSFPKPVVTDSLDTDFFKGDVVCAGNVHNSLHIFGDYNREFMGIMPRNFPKNFIGGKGVPKDILDVRREPFSERDDFVPGGFLSVRRDDGTYAPWKIESVGDDGSLIMCPRHGGNGVQSVRMEAAEVSSAIESGEVVRLGSNAHPFLDREAVRGKILDGVDLFRSREVDLANYCLNVAAREKEMRDFSFRFSDARGDGEMMLDTRTGKFFPAGGHEDSTDVVRVNKDAAVYYDGDTGSYRVDDSFAWTHFVIDKKYYQSWSEETLPASLYSVYQRHALLKDRLFKLLEGVESDYGFNPDECRANIMEAVRGCGMSVELGDLLSQMDFEYSVDGEGKIKLRDLQGANLGGIEEESFDDAADVLERMDVYIADTFLNDVNEVTDSSFESLDDALEWLVSTDAGLNSGVSGGEVDMIRAIVNPELVRTGKLAKWRELNGLVNEDYEVTADNFDSYKSECRRIFDGLFDGLSSKFLEQRKSSDELRKSLDETAALLANDDADAGKRLDEMINRREAAYNSALSYFSDYMERVMASGAGVSPSEIGKVIDRDSLGRLESMMADYADMRSSIDYLNTETERLRETDVSSSPEVVSAVSFAGLQAGLSLESPDGIRLETSRVSDGPDDANRMWVEVERDGVYGRFLVDLSGEGTVSVDVKDGELMVGFPMSDFNGSGDDVPHYLLRRAEELERYMSEGLETEYAEVMSRQFYPDLADDGDITSYMFPEDFSYFHRQLEEFNVPDIRTLFIVKSLVGEALSSEAAREAGVFDMDVDGRTDFVRKYLSGLEEGFRYGQDPSDRPDLNPGDIDLRSVVAYVSALSGVTDGMMGKETGIVTYEGVLDMMIAARDEFGPSDSVGLGFVMGRICTAEKVLELSYGDGYYSDVFNRPEHDVDIAANFRKTVDIWKKWTGRSEERILSDVLNVSGRFIDGQWRGKEEISKAPVVREPEKIAPFEVVDNKSKGRVNISFPKGKDSPYFEEVTRELKNSGWRYAPSTKMWYPTNAAVKDSGKLVRSLLDRYSFYEGEGADASFGSEDIEESVTRGISFFKGAYESDELLSWLNSDAGGGVKFTKEDAAAILLSMGHADLMPPSYEYGRLGVDGDGGLCLVSFNDGVLSRKDMTAEELVRYALEKNRATVADFKEMRPDYSDVSESLVKSFDGYIATRLRVYAEHEDTLRSILERVDNSREVAPDGSADILRDIPAVGRDGTMADILLEMGFYERNNGFSLGGMRVTGDYLFGNREKPVVVFSIDANPDVKLVLDVRNGKVGEEFDALEQAVENFVGKKFASGKIDNEKILEAVGNYRLRREFEERGEPYVVVNWSEGSLGDGTVYPLEQYESLTADIREAMRRNRDFFDNDYNKFADARERGELVGEQEYGFGYYKTEVCACFPASDVQVTCRHELYENEGTLLGHIRATFSDTEVLEAISEAERNSRFSEVGGYAVSVIDVEADNLYVRMQKEISGMADKVAAAKGRLDDVNRQYIVDASEHDGAVAGLDHVKAEIVLAVRNCLNDYFDAVTERVSDIDTDGGVEGYAVASARNAIVDLGRDIREGQDYEFANVVFSALPDYTDAEKFVADVYREFSDGNSRHVAAPVAGKDAVLYFRNGRHLDEFSASPDMNPSVCCGSAVFKEGVVWNISRDSYDGKEWSSVLVADLLASEGWGQERVLLNAMVRCAEGQGVLKKAGLTLDDTFAALFEKVGVVGVDGGKDFINKSVPPEMMLKRLRDALVPKAAERLVNPIRISDGVCEVMVNYGEDGAEGYPKNCLAVSAEVAGRLDKNIVAFGKVDKDSGQVVFEDKSKEPYVRLALIDGGLCPSKDREYYERLSEWVKEHPMRYSSLLPNTADNFPKNLYLMSKIDSGQKDVAVLGHQLLKMADGEERDSIKRLLSSCGSSGLMIEFFNKCIRDGAAMEKSLRKKDGYPPRGES